MTMTLFLFGCAWAAAAEVDSQANLTSEERSWLTNNPEKPALQNNVESPPSEFSAAPGTFIGMGAEVAAQAEHEPGVGFVKRPSDDWNAYLAALFMMLLLAGLLGVSVVLKRRLNQKVADLRESEDKFRTLFQKHAAVKLLIDPDTGGIIDANEMAEKFYGWSVEQLRRMRIQDINTLPPEQVKAEMAKAQGQQRFCFQFRHRRAD